MICAAVALILSLLSPWGAELGAADALTLEVRDGRLTLHAQNVPLAVVLTQLAQASRMTLCIAEPLEERVTLNLADVPLEEGIQRLLRHRNTLFFYRAQAQQPAIVYVWGLQRQTTARAESSQGAASAPTEKEADTAPEHFQVALRVQDLDEQFSALAWVQSPGVATFVQEFLTDPENSVRLTALQWLTAREDVALDAIALALQDGDAVVQQAALEILLHRGGSDQEIEAIRQAAEAGDEVTLRARLSSAFAMEQSFAPVSWQTQ